MAAQQQLRALIIGGGIGGLTTAHALRRAGIAATVFERADDLARIQIGAGLTLWTNALWALRQVALDESVQAAGALLEWFEQRTRQGTVLAHVPVGALARKHGAPTVSIGRADLTAVLAGALDAGVVRLGMTCSGCTQDELGVTAHFTDGHDERGDLLIGADGINSIVRAQLFGSTPPRYAGYITWRGVVDYAPGTAPTRDSFPVLWGRGERFGYYRIGGERVYWFGIVNAPPGQRDPAGQKRVAVLDRFRGWPAPITTMIEATAEDAIHRTDIVDRPPTDTWGEGRVTLLGDAIHPMTFNVGQGACTAIEDAVVLTKCLGAQRDVPAALRAYETARRARTTPLVKRAWQIGRLGQWEHPVACRLRERLIRFTFARLAVQTQEADMAFKV